MHGCGPVFAVKPRCRINKMKYAIVLVPGPENWGAFSPNVPGCVAIGDTPEMALGSFREALEFHLEDLKEQGLPVPEEYTSPEEEHPDGVYLPWARVDTAVKV